MRQIDNNPGRHWDAYSSPESAGWNEERLTHLNKAIDEQVTDCVLVVQGGRIVFSYGDIEHKFLCHSMRKSFLSALIGEEVEAGRINLAATMADLGIDDIGEPLSEIERIATVFDLLTARSGIYHPAGLEPPIMTMIKEKRHSHAPGTFWCYNNWDFNTLGSIFVQQSGISIADAFKERIADPLGMEDFSLEGEKPDAWLENFEISKYPAYPFRMSSRDLARFGQLFLQKGRWSGKTIIQPDWVEESILPYSHAGPLGAYGYCWWLERDGIFVPGVKAPSGSFSACGAGGHYCMVIPSLDMVIVHRVDTEQPGRALTKLGFGHFLKALLKTVNA